MSKRTIVLLTLASIASAQDAAKFPLENLRIEGNARIATQRIVAASGLKTGTPVARPEFDQARAKLLATGAFESVGYSYKPSADQKGYDSTFQVVEVEQLYHYRFENLPASDPDLRNALRKQELLLDDSIPGTPEVLNRYTNALREFLGGKQVVTGEISADDPKELAIVFRPSGERPNVAEVHFTGNTPGLTPILLAAINKIAIGTPFSEPLFRRMLDTTVRALYDERAHIRVAFPKITTGKAPTNAGVIVTVSVEEGAAYKLGNATLVGLPDKMQSQLAKSLSWHKDELVNFVDVDSNVNEIRKKLRGAGYLEPQIDVERKIDDQAHMVDLAVQVKPGPLFVMGKLDIQGLNIIGEPVVRKMWSVPEGQAYPEGYADSFLARVKAEDIFDNLGPTKAETEIHFDTHTIDVTLHFTGAAQEKAKENKRK